MICGDCVEQLALMDAESVDAIVTDPPYGLEFMGKEWDRLAGADAPGYAERPRMTSDHMGKGFKSLPNFYMAGPKAQAWHNRWAVEALRVLKPGGHLVAFGGTRTYHRMVCAVEDAGFEIRDTLMWLYGQGFPKSHNLKGDWEGFGTALKPSVEPVVLARKPLVGTVAGNVSEFGTGALNIDGCRIPLGDGESTFVAPHTAPGKKGSGGWKNTSLATGSQNDDWRKGRWPANVLLDEEAAAMLDEQSGDRAGCHTQRHITDSSDKSVFGMSASPERPSPAFDDSGGASRFFYCAKASSRERNEGLGGEFSLLREAEAVEGAKRDESRNAEQPSMNGGKGNPYNRGAEPIRNSHPTVKPLALMRWLCRLVTPPGGLILDPFAGSGSTLIAAHQEGFRAIGIEQDADYCRIAEARLAWWCAQPQQGML